MEGHEFDSPEEELLHFLRLMHSLYPKFSWHRQYEAKTKVDGTEGFEQEDLTTGLYNSIDVVGLYY